MKLSIVPSEKYPRHELEVNDWVAKEKEIYNQFRSNVVIIRSTTMAYQIALEKSGEVHWIPKSQCRIIERKEVPLGMFWSKKEKED